VFKIDVPNLGYIDGGNDRDIKALTKIQLPYWVTPALLYADWAEFAIPLPFNQRVRNALHAEPRSVRLASLVGGTGSWYWLGQMIVQLLDDSQASELSGVMMKTFKQRLVDLMDQAQHFGGSITTAGASGSAAEEFREGLDSTERQLFSAAQQSTKMTKQWYDSSDKS